MADESDIGKSGVPASGRPELRVVSTPDFIVQEVEELDVGTAFSPSLEDHLIDTSADLSRDSEVIDNDPPEYLLEPIPDHFAEALPVSMRDSQEIKSEIVEAAERLASYNIARIAFEFQEGKHGQLVDPRLVSKVRLENQMNKFQRLIRFLKDGPRLKKELTKEEMLSGLVKNGTPLTSAPAKFALIEGIHFTPKDGTIGLSGVNLYPANNGGVFQPTQEQSEEANAVLKTIEESIETLRLTSETYKAAADSSSGFMSAIYLLGKADDVRRAYEKYASAAQRMATFRAQQISAGIDTRSLDTVIDEKNLMTPALIKNKTSSWKNFAKSFVQYGSLVEEMIDAARRPEGHKPTLEGDIPVPPEIEGGVVDPLKAEVSLEEEKPTPRPSDDLQKVNLLGMDYYVKKDARFIEMAKTDVGIQPPPGHKFAHPEIPLLWALFRDTYPDKFGDASGKLRADDPRSALSERIERQIPHFLYIDDRLPDIKDPIERIESYINTLKSSIPSSSFSPLAPAKSALDNPKISEMLRSAGVVKSAMLENPKYQPESQKLGLGASCPYVFDVNSKFHKINLSKYAPPAGKKLVHPLMPLLVEYHKSRVEMLIRESGIKKPDKDFLRQIGALDANGDPVDFSRMLYIEKDAGGAGSAYQVYSEFMEKTKRMGSLSASNEMPKSYSDEFLLGLPEEIRFKMGVVKNLEADFFDARDRSAKALSEVEAVVYQSPRTDVFTLAFAKEVLDARKNAQNQAGGTRYAESSGSRPKGAKIG